MKSRSRPLALLALVCGGLMTTAPAVAAGDELVAESDTLVAEGDTLVAEVSRWSAFLAETKDAGPLWGDVKQSATPALERTRAALAANRRFLALHRLAGVQELLSSAAYVNEQTRPEALETEWKRMGTALRPEVAGVSGDALEGVRPAAVRALGEAALPQVRVLYEASLDYGRATDPLNGYFYLGSARARRDFAAFCRGLSDPAAPPSPRLRSLAPELEALDSAILDAYRPPASIDRHTHFIRAAGTLKEARELEAAGLRYGALARYLEAAMRLAQARGEAPPEAGVVRARLAEWRARLDGAGADHSIGRLFLELGETEAVDGGELAIAAAVAGDVLPKYLAALQPAAKPIAPKKPAEVTVTLVRWPYT